MLDDALAVFEDDPSSDLDAPAIRRRLLDAMCAVVDASCAFTHETVQIGRRLYFADVLPVGADDFCEATQRLEGRSVFEFVRRVDARPDEAWPGDLHPIERFAVVDRSDVRPLGAWPMYWQPARLRSTLGMTVVHDGVLYGGLACARRLGESPFGRAELAAIRGIEAALARWFVAACRRAAGGCNAPGSQSFVVFDPDGRPLSTSHGAAAWIRSAPVIDRLGRLAAALSASAVHRAVHFVHRAPVRFERLDGPAARVLAIVEEGGHHRPGAREKLTDAQRKVADLAVAGATVKEIAADLGRSPETVRDHLKAIYERLGIGSRVELGRMLDPPPPEPVRGRRRTDGPAPLRPGG